MYQNALFKVNKINDNRNNIAGNASCNDHGNNDIFYWQKIVLHSKIVSSQLTAEHASPQLSAWSVLTLLTFSVN